MDLLKMPLRSRRISQHKLKELVALQNVVGEMKRALARVESEVLSDLLDGADVEQGVHVAYLKTKQFGGKMVQRLKVK